jgi:hypothetical protein
MANFGEDVMLVGTPFRKLRKVFGNPYAVGVKNVRPVRVHQYSVGVESIVSIASDMGPLINQQNLKARICQPFGNYRSGESCANDQYVYCHAMFLVILVRPPPDRSRL